MAKVRLLQRMFALYPNTRLDNPEGTLAAYLEALDGLTVGELGSAIRRVIHDSDPRHQGFVPTPDRLIAAACYVDPASLPYMPNATTTERAARLEARKRESVAHRASGVKRVLAAGARVPEIGAGQ